MTGTQANKYHYPCTTGDHAACHAVEPTHTALVCYCRCHDHSVACRIGAHALCDRYNCECGCGHAINHERTAQRQAWAA